MKQRVLIVSPLLLVCCHVSIAQIQSQSSGSRKIVIESVSISGTQSIDSVELAEITGVFAGSTFNDDPDELQERIRAQFQDHGYFNVKIEKLDMKVIDPLGSPKPVRLEAEVTEGLRCQLSSIEFGGNHALSSEALRGKFPIKVGGEFKRSKIAGGLDEMRSVYGSLGYLDSVFIPKVTFDSSSTVKLKIEVEEGPQYRMDQFEVVGPSELSEKLQSRWDLESGAVFDRAYLGTFLEKNHSILPGDFSQSNGVDLFEDCPHAKVSVHFHVTTDPQHAVLDREKRVDCPHSSQTKVK